MSVFSTTVSKQFANVGQEGTEKTGQDTESCDKSALREVGWKSQVRSQTLDCHVRPAVCLQAGWHSLHRGRQCCLLFPAGRFPFLFIEFVSSVPKLDLWPRDAGRNDVKLKAFALWNESQWSQLMRAAEMAWDQVHDLSKGIQSKSPICWNLKKSPGLSPKRSGTSPCAERSLYTSYPPQSHIF